MRLLNVHSLEFRDFDLADTKSYVVASHTWVPEDEITYDEFRQGCGHEKSGYQKVMAFANYVKEHVPGVEWMWMDTCCINQRDTQEVRKSIQSMFRWYLHAAVCLAYLPDVHASGDARDFADSRWFRRGWTLQELLASRAVIFLDVDWRVIGHKADSMYKRKGSVLDMGASLNSAVAEVTGVPEAVLGNFYQSRLMSIEERLQWMEGRETSEPEDMSYSLMGVFDVTMYAEYNVGKDEARRRLLEKIHHNAATLATLPATPAAAFNSRENDVVPSCLPGTRVDLLREIEQWASADDGACIFWLGGMAGTGKSTVLKTVAQTFQDQHRLAASFCFKRGEEGRGTAARLIATVSAQLARRLPDVGAGVISALDMDPDVVQKPLRDQFVQLVLEPLKRFASSPVYGPAWIICIDALDECDSDSDTEFVISQLAQLTELQSANFRLFITSRPDLPLRLGFSRISSHAYKSARLEDVSNDVVMRDITSYLENKLAGIRSTYASLNGPGVLKPVDWPGREKVQTLAHMASPLFIFAATVCRLLGEPDEDPNSILRLILKRRLEPSELDRTYQPVLDRLLVGKDSKSKQQSTIDDFRIVVGSIIVLAEPLTVRALSRLLDVHETTVTARLQRLYSVLDVPSPGEGSGPVRMHHLSFRDYLTDDDKRDKTPFWIDETQQHRTVAAQCLRLLSQTLQEDVCSVEKPGTRRPEVTKQRVDMSITREVAYACSYWVHHLHKGKEQLQDDDQVHRFLRAHFLHWLEALSWLGKVSEAVIYISNLLSLVQDDRGAALSKFLRDARDFAKRSRVLIELAPLATYSSALLFTPKWSIIRQHFQRRIPERFSVKPGVATSRWNAELQMLESDYGSIKASAYSSDRQTVALGSLDKTVRLWHARTGKEMAILRGHEDQIWAVAFSLDGQVVVTGSSDSTVRLWNAQTGEQMHILYGHGWDIIGVAFSPDQQTVASGGGDKTVRLWNAQTGEEMHKLEGHESFVTAVAFSPDGQTVASGSGDNTIRLWDSRTGKEMNNLRGHEDDVMAVAFSPDGQMVASGSVDKTVRLWNARTGEEIHQFKGIRGAYVLDFDATGTSLSYTFGGSKAPLDVSPYVSST